MIKNKVLIFSSDTNYNLPIDKGSYLIEERKVTDISQLLKGLPNLTIQGVDNYSLRLNHVSLLQTVDSLSTIDAKDNIFDVKIAFDKKTMNYW